MGSGAKWQKGRAEKRSPAAAEKAEEESLFNVAENSARSSWYLSGIHTGIAAFFLPLYPKLFRIHQAGDYKIRALSGDY